VLLPHGQTFGRLCDASAVMALDAVETAEVPVQLLSQTYDRGRSHLIAPGQAAESIVRQQIQEPRLFALSTTTAPQPGQEHAWQYRVSHIDGRHWDVVAMGDPNGDALPVSCGKEPMARWQWPVVSDSGR